MEMVGKGSGTAEKVAEKAEATAQMAASVGRKVFKGTTVGVLVASMLLGMAFSGADEITADQIGTTYNQPPIVMDIGDFGNATVDDDDGDTDDEKGAKPGVVARFKQAVMSLPRAIRLFIILPMWVMGTGLLTMISVFWKFLFASPVGGFIMSAFAGFGVILGLFALTAKMLFPEIPLRQILTRKNFIAVGIAALALAGADAVAPLFWEQYPVVAGLVKVIGGAGIVTILCLRVRMLFYKDKYRNMPEPVC